MDVGLVSDQPQRDLGCSALLLIIQFVDLVSHPFVLMALFFLFRAGAPWMLTRLSVGVAAGDGFTDSLYLAFGRVARVLFLSLRLTRSTTR